MELHRFQVILVLLTFMVYIKGNVSDKSGEEEKPSSCTTLTVAKTSNEEVAKLFKSVCLSEVVGPYLGGWYEEHENTYQSCFPDVYDRNGKKTTYFRRYIYGPLEKVAQFSITYGNMVRGIESLKKSITDVAEIFKVSWMKVRKLLKMNQGFFEAFDMFFQDSIMQRAANLSSEVPNESEKDTIFSYFRQFNKEFEKADALMPLIPRRPLLTDPKRFQRNIIYNQLYSAVYNTKYKQYLKAYGFDDSCSMFTEIFIKKNIKIATNNLVDAYIMGFDEATEFSKKAKEYEERLDKVVEKINAISPGTPCETTKKEAEALAKESSILQTLVNVNMGVRVMMDFDTKTVKWFENVNVLELMNQVLQAMNFVKSYIPRDVHPELDELYSYVISKANQSVVPKFVKSFDRNTAIWLHSVTNKDWIKHYKKLSDMLTKVVKLCQCYLNIFQFFGRTYESCSEGVGSLQEIYDDISSRIKIDETECWSLNDFSRPSFEDIKEFIEKAANEIGFNKDCEQNNQQDEPGDVRSIVIDDYNDESEKEKFSPTQRFTVCDLRVKWSKSDEEIIDMMAIRDLQKVKAVRCKNSKRADSMYAREKQVDSD